MFNGESMKLLKRLSDTVRLRCSGGDADGGILDQLKLKDKEDGIAIIRNMRGK